MVLFAFGWFAVELLLGCVILLLLLDCSQVGLLDVCVLYVW